MIGGLFPSSEHTFVIGNPLVVSSVTYEHVIGHIFWGAVIGLGTLSIRYIVLGGSFAIFLDSDHLLQFLDIELVSRMSHSIPFAVIHQSYLINPTLALVPVPLKQYVGF